MKDLRAAAALAVSLLLVGASAGQADVVTEWNTLAVQCISTATPPARGGPPGLFDLALMHAAMHDAVQAIEHRYEPYFATPPATGRESRAAAAAAAAHDVLVVLCPSAVAALDAAFLPYKNGMDPGLGVGSAAAAALLPLRRPTPPASFAGGTGIGEWRPTPPGNLPMQFVFMATTEPFTLTSPDQFRPPGPPALNSRQYAREYDEVKKYGAVGSHPAVAACPAPSRTDEARFWSGNFVAQWNEATRLIALDQQLPIGDSARLLALVNLAAADAAIAVWDSKVHFNFWRPITAIQQGDIDGNPRTQGDPAWTPFIQSVHFPSGTPTTTSQTPAYPDYVSGANGLTGAVTKMLRLYFRTDRFRFYVNKATAGTVAICTNPRSFDRFSDAAQEVVDARIWLGIHFRTADADARRLGQQVASWTFHNALRPIGHDGDDDNHDHDDHDDHDRDHDRDH